jgi:hypothetical protein
VLLACSSLPADLSNLSAAALVMTGVRHVLPRWLRIVNRLLLIAGAYRLVYSENSDHIPCSLPRLGIGLEHDWIFAQ